MWSTTRRHFRSKVERRSFRQNRGDQELWHRLRLRTNGRLLHRRQGVHTCTLLKVRFFCQVFRVAGLDRTLLDEVPDCTGRDKLTGNMVKLKEQGRQTLGSTVQLMEQCFTCPFCGTVEVCCGLVAVCGLRDVARDDEWCQ